MRLSNGSITLLSVMFNEFQRLAHQVPQMKNSWEKKFFYTDELYLDNLENMYSKHWWILMESNRTNLSLWSFYYNFAHFL